MATGTAKRFIDSNRYRFVVVAAAVAALTLGGGIASAHTVRFNSNLTARFTEVPGPPDNSSPAGRDYFSGRVTSSKDACKKRLLQIHDYEPETVSSLPIATNSDGRWRLEVENPANRTYYAKIAKKVLRNTARHTHICKPARSPDFVVTDQPKG